MQIRRILILGMLLANLTVRSQDKAALRRQHFNIATDAIALKGYDPVNYFIKQSAVKGSRALAFAHQGILYYFSSSENKEKFKANPLAYEPQYGGWCAYAMGATGEKVPIDPATFKIINGKLFLFYNRYLNNTLPKWNKDEQSLHIKADGNWSKFFK